MESRPPYYGFLKSCRDFPNNPSLEIEDKYYSYFNLENISKSIAATIQRYQKNENPHLIAVFASRSITAYSGILGTLLSGNGYLPINLSYPVSRLQYIINLTGCRTMVVDL